MGLDMHLQAEKYVSKTDVNWQGKTRKDKPNKTYRQIIKAMGAEGFADTDDLSSLTVKLNVGYWRKANAIHQWFVENVQEGVDDCGHYYVKLEQLAELRDICQRILDAGKEKKKNSDENDITVQLDEVLEAQVESALSDNGPKVEHPLGGLGVEFVVTDDPDLLAQIDAWNEQNPPQLMTYDQVELAEELLPTQSGFFFGSTEYDQGYIWDLENTIEICNRVLNNLPEKSGWYLYYHSSW